MQKNIGIGQDVAEELDIIRNERKCSYTAAIRELIREHKIKKEGGQQS